MKYDDLETNYERNIRNARKAVKGLSGYDRALKISAYFESIGHPHADCTFMQVRFNNSEGQSDRQFAINLMREMAYLVAVNQHL
jgi:hypothetical protein